MEVMEEATWRARTTAHEARVDRYLGPHLARRAAGLRHPVHDFLFGYYSHRPAQLRRWHPGHGVVLAGDGHGLGEVRGYVTVPEGVTVDAEHVAAQRPLVTSLHRLLVATAGRPASYGCFGMHEWAMVYRLDEDETRHPAWPLRLGPAGTDRVVESHRIACSHFDAFRFFTDAARPRNALSPSAGDRPDFEQPGCLHAGMDLYKVGYRLSPMIPSDLLADAFELAWDIRILDMRAAPYDLTGLTLDPSGEPWTPLAVETPEGKREYADKQRRFAARAAPIRTGLIQQCERLLT